MENAFAVVRLWSGLRISPLTPRYVLPRTTLLHSWTPQTDAGTLKPPNAGGVGIENPEPLVMQAHNLPQIFKTNKSRNGNP